jgi:lincosamide nucleotidyltransferase A/C/D/E
MVNAKEAVNLYNFLQSHNIPIWLTGGWGIDALLGEKTRTHKDLDVLILLDDVYKLCQLLAERGYRLKMTWEENRWAMDADDIKVPTAFVLHDSAGRELDCHAIQLDEKGSGIPTWENTEGIVLNQQDLRTIGWIEGTAVHCISPETQFQAHQGYQLPENQKKDLTLLQEKFSINLADINLTNNQQDTSHLDVGESHPENKSTP